MKVSFEGIGEMVATFPVSGAVLKGNMVNLAADGQVSACSDGDAFSGVAVNVREGFAGIQFAGLAQVSYTGTAPGCGWVALAADASGGAKIKTGGREYLVVAVDTTAKTAVVRL